MKNSTFVGLSALLLVGTGAAYLYFRKRQPTLTRNQALLKSNPNITPAQLQAAGIAPGIDPAVVGVNAADMIAAGLPLPAGFAPVPTAPMNGLQLVSSRQLNTRSKGGVEGMGSFMTDVEAVAKFSLTMTEASVLPFDKNLTRKLGQQLHALPGMHNVKLVGPLKSKVGAPAASTLDTSTGTSGFQGTGNGLFMNTATGQILEAAPSLLQQYAGQPASILPMLINGAVMSAGTTDPTTGLPSLPSSPGSAQTYGWPSAWTNVPGYSPWQFIADQPVGGMMLPTYTQITPLPIGDPATGPGGVATPTNVKPKGVTSAFNPLVAVGAAAAAVGGLFVMNK